MTFRTFCLLTLMTVGCSSKFPNFGEIAYRTFPLSNGHHRFEVTDGHVFIQSVVSTTKHMQQCTVTQDSNAVLELSVAEDTLYKDIGTFAVNDMINNCKAFNKRKRGILDNGSAEPRGILDNGSPEPFEPEKTGQPEGPSGSFAIFPGTKWCGYENDAKDYDDLGKYKATDTCCRTHDHCPYFIDRWQSKYNYFNPYPWTLSNCDCDNTLYNCLKKVNNTVSNEVGELFFGVLNVKCFSFEKGKYCEQRHWSQLWCEKSSTGYKAVPEDFPHKWGDKHVNNNTDSNVSNSIVG